MYRHSADRIRLNCDGWWCLYGNVDQIRENGLQIFLGGVGQARVFDAFAYISITLKVGFKV